MSSGYFFATLITEWSGYQAFAQLAVVVLILFTWIEWKYLELTSKFITLVAIGLTLALLLSAKISFLQLSMLCGNVAFFTFFLIAQSLLKEAALTSNSANSSARPNSYIIQTENKFRIKSCWFYYQLWSYYV